MKSQAAREVMQWWPGRRIGRFALSLLLISVAAGFANAAVASATVTEPNGLTVPQNGMNGEVELNTFFTNVGESIDWQADARSGPGTFFPAPGSSITFVLNQAGLKSGLAWYNATGTAPAVSDLHTIIPPNSPVGTVVSGSVITSSAAYTGGLVGFALVGGQTHYSQNQLNQVCSDTSVCSPPGPWILALQYASTKSPMSAYLAFEDGTATTNNFTNDGDFNDDVFFLSGMLPAQCSDGIDNDGDGKADRADRGCWSGPGGTYNPQDNDESDDPPLPAVTLPPTVTSPITATVTAVGTGVGTCVISVDGSPLTTTIATGAPTKCTATAPPGLAAGTHAVTVSYTETFGTVATASAHLLTGPASVPAVTASPRITGTARPRHTLRCETGTWTQNPTSFTYAWNRNGTPIAGATGASYVVQPIDEGNMLTCSVTATNARGASAPARSAGVRVPVPVVKGCPAVTGSVTRSAVGPVKLGDTRREAHRAFPRSSSRGKKYEDFFCFTPSGIRVGYASPKLVKTLSKRERKRYAGRVIWISTASAHYAIAGIRPGATVAAARKALKLIGPFTVGLNTWYLARDGGVTAVFKVRHGLIEEIGIGYTALTKNTRAQRRFLTSFE
jgi:hypothetical protein